MVCSCEGGGGVTAAAAVTSDSGRIPATCCPSSVVGQWEEDDPVAGSGREIYLMDWRKENGRFWLSDVGRLQEVDWVECMGVGERWVGDVWVS